MDDDLDDTVIVPTRPQKEQSVPDLDDTVIPVPAPTTAPVVARRRIDHATGEPIDDDPPAVTAPDDEPVRAIVEFYSFRVGLGEESIMLDRPCYIGRQPSPPRVPTSQPPRLVRVPSPLKEVSSTHLEVRQVGSSVIVSDLKSTNGSIVMIPGSVPRKLRQGESMVVSPGTLVDIGDGNILQVLPIQRPAWPAERQP